jgi:hypothetical protein
MSSSSDQMLTGYEGYVYCASNTNMPGILKVGMTRKPPTERIRAANAKKGTWGPPSSYKLEFSKKVPDVRLERKLHTVLTKYHSRINPRREFFGVKLHDVLDFFNLIPGEFWEDTNSSAVTIASDESDVSVKKRKSGTSLNGSNTSQSRKRIRVEDDDAADDAADESTDDAADESTDDAADESTDDPADDDK